MSDFKTPHSEDSYYDVFEDWSLIESSFAQQYGIRLRSEGDMTYNEFLTLLVGIMPETPLGKIVSIRAEKNRKVIRSFNSEQKKIHSDWKKKQCKNISKKEQMNVISQFEALFKSAYGGDLNGR